MFYGVQKHKITLRLIYKIYLPLFKQDNQYGMPDYEMLKYDEMFFEAEGLIEQRQIAQAVSLLETIIEEQPDYGKAHNHLAWLYEHEYKEFSRSEKHYKAAITFCPTYPSTYINYCHLLSRLGQLDELAALLKTAQNVEGMKKSQICHEYGVLHELRREYMVAANYYQDAILYSLINSDIATYQAALERSLLKYELTSEETEE